MEVFPVKITNSDIIKSGERELIDSIIGDLDWDAIEELVKTRHKLKIQDDVEYRQGDIVVHNNQVAYKLDFDVKMTLSVVFDRDGNYLSLVTPDVDDDVELSEESPIAAEETDSATDEEAGDISAAASDGSNGTVNEETAEIMPAEADDSNGAEDMTADSDSAMSENESVVNEPDPSEVFSSDDVPTATPEHAPKENFSKMASHIAEMISEINDE